MWTNMYVAAFTDATPFVNTIELEKVETSAGEGDRLVIVNLKLTDRVDDGIILYRSDASAEFHHGCFERQGLPYQHCRQRFPCRRN